MTAIIPNRAIKAIPSIGAVGAGVLRRPAKVKGSMFFSKTKYKYQSSGNMTIVILLCNILLFLNMAMTGFRLRIMKKRTNMMNSGTCPVNRVDQMNNDKDHFIKSLFI